MPHLRSWTSPPTRREITLLLFSLTVFVLSYNLEASLGIVGVHPQKLTSSYLSSIGLGTKDPGFDPDGRRPKEWRDELESIIAGEWEWREGEVSGVARGSSAASGSGRNAVIYNFGGSRKVARSAQKEDRGVSLNTGVTVKDQFIKWGKDVPETSVVAHTPGYTVLDNVIAVNGTLFVVANDWTKLPKLGDIASSSLDATKPPRVQDWHILTTQDAAEMFGPYAAKIHGTSWLALGNAESQDPYTLFSLFRTHASLSSTAAPASFTSSSGLHIIAPSPDTASSPHPSSVPAPLRIIFPHVPTFSSPNIPPGPGEDPKSHPPPRDRAYTGIHPFIPKAVFATLGVWYTEDWQDLADMHVPFLLDRVVIADRGAAERGRAHWAPAPSARTDELKRRAAGQEGEPAWAAPFVGLSAPEAWWAPVRAALLRYLHLADGAGAGTYGASESKGASLWGLSKKQAPRPVVAYVSMQDEPVGAGARLSSEDHERLVTGLKALEKQGVLGEVHVVRGNGSVPAPEWEARMSAIARATIVMGPYGLQLADSVYMRSPLEDSAAASGSGKKPAQGASQSEASAPAPLLMEFFPPGTFVRDQQFAMHALGIDYMAWWNERKFAGTSLPDVVSPSVTPGQDPRVPLDVDAVLRTVREEASKRTVA
ncbi:hypothetical protein C8Q73DRAFT_310806 [Cubamyces lactineus]|nr:hypothetical protein C8Q73DRAFT_310806 [Cubamyces lactineus]